MIALTASTRPTTIIFHEIGISVSNSYITLRVHVTVIAQQDFIRVFLRFHMDRAYRRIQSVLSPILHFFCHEGNTKLPKLHKQGCNLFPRPRETLRPHRSASFHFRPYLVTPNAARLIQTSTISRIPIFLLRFLLHIPHQDRGSKTAAVVHKQIPSGNQQILVNYFMLPLMTKK